MAVEANNALRTGNEVCYPELHCYYCLMLGGRTDEWMWKCCVPYLLLRFSICVEMTMNCIVQTMNAKHVHTLNISIKQKNKMISLQVPVKNENKNTMQ